jgi:hypothetical protein
MVSKLQFLRSVTAGSSPVGLSAGEIAFNLIDKKLFIGNGDSNITRLNGTTESVAAGTGYFEADLTEATANAYTDARIADLIDSAPAVLDTLRELAQALADDPNFATTITTAVSGVQANLDAEVSRAQSAEAALSASLSAEIARAEAAEGILTSDLAAEVARAQAAEAQLTSDLSAEVSRAQAAESVLTSDLAAEVARATSAEASLAADIDAAEIAATNAVNAETSRATAAESALSARISAIEDGIDLGVF